MSNENAERRRRDGGRGRSRRGGEEPRPDSGWGDDDGWLRELGRSSDSGSGGGSGYKDPNDPWAWAKDRPPAPGWAPTGAPTGVPPGPGGPGWVDDTAETPGRAGEGFGPRGPQRSAPGEPSWVRERTDEWSASGGERYPGDKPQRTGRPAGRAVVRGRAGAAPEPADDDGYNADPRLADPSSTDPHMPDPRAPHPISPVDGVGRAAAGRARGTDAPDRRGAPAGREAAVHDERGRGPAYDERPAGPSRGGRPAGPGPDWAGRPQSPARPDRDDRPQSPAGPVRRVAPPGREAAFHDERGRGPADDRGRGPADDRGRGPADDRGRGPADDRGRGPAYDDRSGPPPWEQGPRSGRRGAAGPVSPGYPREVDPRDAPPPFPDERAPGRRPAGPPRQVDRPAALHDETRRGRPYDERVGPYDDRDGPRRPDRPGGWEDRRGTPAGPPPRDPRYRERPAEPVSPAYRDEPVSPAYRERPVEPVSPAYPDGPRRGEPPFREHLPEPERRPYREERPAAYRQPAPPPRPEAPERRDERPAPFREPVPPRYADERPAAFREPVRPADERPAPFREPVQPSFADAPEGPRRDRRPAAFQAERTAPPPAHIDDLPTAPLSPPPPRRPERLGETPRRPERDGGTPDPWLATPPPPFAPEPADRDIRPPAEDSQPAAEAAGTTAAVRVPAPRTGDSAPAYPRQLADDELHAATVGGEPPAPEPAASRHDLGWFAAAAEEAAARTQPVEPPPAAEPVEPPPAEEPVEAVEPAPEAEPAEEPQAAAPEVPAEPFEETAPAEPPPAAEPVEPLPAAADEPAKPKPPLVDGLRLDLREAVRPVSTPPAEPEPAPAPAAEPAAEPVAASTDEVDPQAVEPEPVAEAPSEPATPEPVTEAAEPQEAASDDGDSTGTSADVETDEPDAVADAPSEPAIADSAPADSAADDAGPAPSPVSPDQPETAEKPAPTGEPDPDGPDEKASADTVLPVPEGTAAGAATALRAPTMLHPVVKPDAEDEKPRPKDPEQVLAAYQWRFHHETLRELVEDPDELRSIRDQLTAKVDVATDNAARARLLSLRAVVSRILGDLGKAFSDGKLALAHAEATGELRRISIAQARLAHVLQWRGDYAEADRLNALANSPELPDRLRATMHEHAGRSCYDQGRYIEACNHFEKALDLRKVDDPELIARTEQALDAVLAKVATNGLGPYPRDEDEILQLHKPPKPSFSEKVQRWGYVDPAGDWAIAPSYAEVQPFKEGVAWVRRPETEPWELIDESGEVLIFASLGYLGVGSFHDGLAWVSHNGRSNWLAIDKSGDVAINIGFEDVRPFRGGVAAVKRGGWGAIDKNGRTVLPPQYTGFSTALTDGRYVDGFTDEGLAVVDSGGRKGVVDRNGRVLVPPRFPALVIHPVAFLVGGGQGLWGALDRRGEPLIDIVHGSRAAVTEEIDRLLADTKPVL